jgi:hypothetical protein
MLAAADEWLTFAEAGKSFVDGGCSSRVEGGDHEMAALRLAGRRFVAAGSDLALEVGVFVVAVGANDAARWTVERNGRWMKRARLVCDVAFSTAPRAP